VVRQDRQLGEKEVESETERGIESRSDITIEELRRLLRQPRDDPKPERVKERLIEMYRKWWQARGVTPSNRS